MIGKEWNRIRATWQRGLPGRQSRRILLVCTVVLSGANLLGHQDPVGDVHPYVVVQNGKFVIAWHDNEPDWFEKPRRYYQQVYTIDGRSSGAKEELYREFPVEHREYIHHNWGTPYGDFVSKEWKYEQRVSGATFLFQTTWRQRDVLRGKSNARKEAVLQLVKVLAYERSREILEKGGELWHRALIPEKTVARDLPNFPASDRTTLRGAVVTRDQVVLLSYERPTEKQLKLPERSVRHRDTRWQKLWVYGRPGLGKPKIHSIGLCNRLLPPFGQNLLAVQGHQALFVWLEPIPDCIYWETPAQHALGAKEFGYPKERPRAKLYLSSLNLKTGKMKSRVLAGDVHWNTALSLAVIDKRFLVAYHFGSEFHRPRDPNPETPRSVIKVIFGDVPELP